MVKNFKNFTAKNVNFNDFVLQKYVTHVPCRKLHSAFTLAEVLITLAIVGVVAAITMPIIKSKIDETVYKSKLKKTYSTVAQAEKLALAEYDLTFYKATNCGSNPENEILPASQTRCAIINYGIKGGKWLDRSDPNHPCNYAPNTFCTKSWWGEHKAYMMPSGVILSLPNSGYSFGVNVLIFADLNGKLGPNRKTLGTESESIRPSYNNYIPVKSFLGKPSKFYDVYGLCIEKHKGFLSELGWSSNDNCTAAEYIMTH